MPVGKWFAFEGLHRIRFAHTHKLLFFAEIIGDGSSGTTIQLHYVSWLAFEHMSVILVSEDTQIHACLQPLRSSFFFFVEIIGDGCGGPG